MKELIYYNPKDVMSPTSFSDISRFCSLFRVLKPIVLVDRTGICRDPLGTKPLFPMPVFRTTNQTFEEIANKRAKEILDHADQLDCDINLMWSGGIDSTLALVSLLKMGDANQRQRINVLMSEESITEAPEFYSRHICGKLRMGSAQLFPNLLGSRHIFVSGEHSDQLFGSDMIGKLIVNKGLGVVHRPYSRDLLESFFDPEGIMTGDVNFCLDMFEHLASKAPVPIETNFHFLWWINFNLKWQSVYLRTLSYTAARNTVTLSPAHVDAHFFPFFNTEEFQLWSMNNLDKRMSGDWSTYKWVAKDIIFDFTKDDSYRRNKVKRGSLFFIILRKSAWHYMWSDYSVSQTADVQSLYRADNTFDAGTIPWADRKTVT